MADIDIFSWAETSLALWKLFWC